MKILGDRVLEPTLQNWLRQLWTFGVGVITTKQNVNPIKLLSVLKITQKDFDEIVVISAKNWVITPKLVV